MGWQFLRILCSSSSLNLIIMIVINDTTTTNNSNDDDDDDGNGDGDDDDNDDDADDGDDDDDDDDDLEAAHPHSRSWSNIPGRIGSGKPWFSRTGEKRSTRRKTSQSKIENQQQTQPTYDMSLSHCKSYLPK